MFVDYVHLDVALLLGRVLAKLTREGPLVTTLISLVLVQVELVFVLLVALSTLKMSIFLSLYSKVTCQH